MSKEPGSGSDPDLVAATNATVELKDAVALEFDFVPNSTQVKFNYIFASKNIPEVIHVQVSQMLSHFC
jgi:hypothetical protein